MFCEVDNRQSVLVNSGSTSSLCVKSTPGIYFVRPEDFAWLEMSLVGEVERVFVDHEGPRFFRVLTVVNQRSPELRKEIYQREKAIIDAWPRFEFDFHILARENHDLDEVVDSAERPSYSRR